MAKTVVTSAVLIGIGLAASSLSAAELGGTYVAGTMPDRRPPMAPVVVDVNKDNAWFQKALKGVEAPYPASVQAMVSNQGNWYTPFTIAGMVGHYDIRKWHTP